MIDLKTSLPACSLALYLFFLGCVSVAVYKSLLWLTRRNHYDTKDANLRQGDALSEADGTMISEDEPPHRKTEPLVTSSQTKKDDDAFAKRYVQLIYNLRWYDLDRRTAEKLIAIEDRLGRPLCVQRTMPLPALDQDEISTVPDHTEISDIEKNRWYFAKYLVDHGHLTEYPDNNLSRILTRHQH